MSSVNNISHRSVGKKPERAPRSNSVEEDPIPVSLLTTNDIHKLTSYIRYSCILFKQYPKRFQRARRGKVYLYLVMSWKKRKLKGQIYFLNDALRDVRCEKDRMRRRRRLSSDPASARWRSRTGQSSDSSEEIVKRLH